MQTRRTIALGQSATTGIASGMRKAPKRGQRIATVLVLRRQPVLVLVFGVPHHLDRFGGPKKLTIAETSTGTAMLSTSTSGIIAGDGRAL